MEERDVPQPMSATDYRSEVPSPLVTLTAHTHPLTPPFDQQANAVMCLGGLGGA